ncbi:fructokinase [Actinorhabdospora filicis]|uniref:Fructokinase n=1 Tax=Actinorhabdospora filicis TaxID=1785913 RepID=A0A9W6SIW8_9ACTN|nr:fructokinase [Actinorhabdospora filicis]
MGAVIVVVGENVIDLLPGRDGGTRALVGGGPANTAIALARLGAPVRFAGRAGEDAHADAVRARLAAEGLTWTDVPGPTPVAEVTLDDAGQASYAFRLDGAADFTRAAPPALSPRDAVHLGSLAAYLEPGATVLETWIERVHTSHVVSFDPNVRPTVLDLDAARARTERYAPMVALMRVSTPDVAALYGDEPPASAAARWLASGCGLVVVTDGEAPAAAHGPLGTVTVPIPRVDVVDTVGAGDTFDAAMLAWLAARDALTPASFARAAASRDAVAAMLRYAAAASALACTREGADPPTFAEIPL